MYCSPGCGKTSTAKTKGMIDGEGLGEGLGEAPGEGLGEGLTDAFVEGLAEVSVPR